MKNAERKANFSKYILLTLGSIIILIPLLATIFSSFKSTKDIVNNFFGFPTQPTLENFQRLLADGIGGYDCNHGSIFGCCHDFYSHGCLLYRS